MKDRSRTGYVIANPLRNIPRKDFCARAS